jgi:hypothetical protein
MCRGVEITYKQQKMQLSPCAYNYDRRIGYGKDQQRPNHPVTMMVKKVLCRMINLLELPANPLDNLVHLCGGRQVVSEMTGRKHIMEVQPDGSFKKVRRARDVAQSALNLAEKAHFMDGSKRVAIISDAASTGISLHVRCHASLLLKSMLSISR